MSLQHFSLIMKGDYKRVLCVVRGGYVQSKMNEYISRSGFLERKTQTEQLIILKIIYTCYRLTVVFKLEYAYP